jgi:geranylgeranyl pyrophosphate synthase
VSSTGGTGSAPSLAPLAAVLDVGGPELAGLLVRAEERLAEVAGEGGDGGELGEHALATLSAGGKRLRPLVVFICAGPGAGEDAVRSAVAVELVHMATLVHDDVLDRSQLRRGRPTVYASSGRLAATATGDFLFAQAFAELVHTERVEAVRVLSSAASALARGELMQRADAWSEDIDPERYLERCALKTGRLFEAACRLGAISGGPGEAAAASLGAFGARIGLAFQILDDVLDVSGPTERTGKPRGADLLDGTVTLPLILARRRDPELASIDLRSAVTEPAQADALCDRIARSGALSESREQALTFVAEAKAALSDLTLDDRTRQALELVADGVVERYA